LQNKRILQPGSAHVTKEQTGRSAFIVGEKPYLSRVEFLVAAMSVDEDSHQ
jgi:hypothetical protein